MIFHSPLFGDQANEFLQPLSGVIVSIGGGALDDVKSAGNKVILAVSLVPAPGWRLEGDSPARMADGLDKRESHQDYDLPRILDNLAQN